MRRLLALVAAIVMVLLAVFVRARIDDDGGGGGGSTDGPGDGERFRVACASELEAACDVLADEADVEVFVEPAGRTADAVAGADPTFDAWLVPQPWPAMADIGRQQAGNPGVFPETGPTLARSPLLTVAVREREFVAPCQAVNASWRCVGDSAALGARVGWVDPESWATGALNLGAVTIGWFGHSDVARNDLELDTAYQSWFSELVKGARTDAKPVLTLLRETAFGDLAVSTEADWRTSSANATADRLADLEVLYPEPVVTADVVLAPVAGRTLPRDLAAAATDALAGAGWRLEGERPRDGEPTLPSDTNLPSAGVLVALRDEAE